MALPTWVGHGGISTSSSAVTPNMPAGNQALDILFLLGLVAASNTLTLSTANGFTATPNSPQEGTIGGGPRLYCFWKRAVGSDASPTLTYGTGSLVGLAGLIVGIRGCVSAGNPWNVTSQGHLDSEQTGVSIPGATTTAAECLILELFGSCFNTNTSAMISGWTNSDLGNLTERFDQAVQGVASVGMGLAVATGEKAVAGGYGATTATLSAADAQAYMTFALQPEIVVPSTSDAIAVPDVPFW